MADYIVVSAENAQLARIALGMLGAEYVSMPYPIPGTPYIWDPQPNVAGNLVAFGPLDTGIDPPFGAWCLGRELEVEDPEADFTATITIPSTAQTLTSEWFAPIGGG